MIKKEHDKLEVRSKTLIEQFLIVSVFSFIALIFLGVSTPISLYFTVPLFILFFYLGITNKLSFLSNSVKCDRSKEKIQGYKLSGGGWFTLYFNEIEELYIQDIDITHRLHSSHYAKRNHQYNLPAPPEYILNLIQKNGKEITILKDQDLKHLNKVSRELADFVYRKLHLRVKKADNNPAYQEILRDDFHNKKEEFSLGTRNLIKELDEIENTIE
ncbi:MAG: hypothetical protein ACLFQV_11840 [Vulcanimicrobiota bacterium]